MIRRISHASYFVLDQERARRFYTEKLGFEVRNDVTMGGEFEGAGQGFRWLTVGPPDQPDVEIILADPGMGNDPATAESGSYFSTARLNRQQARDNALSLLQEAAKDEKADQTAVDEANASIQTMADATVTEAQIENLITAKGYTDCVAFLGEDSISVVVSALDNGMTDADAARIGEIVMEQTGLKADQIKIIEAE